MKIINQTNSSCLAEDAALADTYFRRIQGLLAEKELSKGRALILRPCNSIHTFFMRFPIDVLFLDKQNRVVKTISGLKPFRLSGVYFNASIVIELPCGTLQSAPAHPGDIISLE